MKEGFTKKGYRKEGNTKEGYRKEGREEGMIYRKEELRL